MEEVLLGLSLKTAISKDSNGSTILLLGGNLLSIPDRILNVVCLCLGKELIVSSQATVCYVLPLFEMLFPFVLAILAPLKGPLLSCFL